MASACMFSQTSVRSERDAYNNRREEKRYILQTGMGRVKMFKMMIFFRTLREILCNDQLPC